MLNQKKKIINYLNRKENKLTFFKLVNQLEDKNIFLFSRSTLTYFFPKILLRGIRKLVKVFNKKRKYTRFRRNKYFIFSKNKISKHVYSTNISNMYYRYKPYWNLNKIYSTDQFTDRILLTRKLVKTPFPFFGTQLKKKKGGRFAISLGIVSFVPGRYKALNARGLQSFLSSSLTFRGCRRSTCIFNIKINLISNFRQKTKN